MRIGKRFHIVTVMLLTLGAGPARPAREASVREATLENGLTVIAVEARTAPVVSVWTFYRAGSRNERPGRTGLSHLVEHATFRGAEGLSPAEWTGVFERHAGSWNGYTWLDETAYVATVPKDLLDLALRGEALRMSKASFAPADVETERNTVLAELDGADANAAERLDQEVVAAAFKAHPYALPPAGWKADLTRATRESVREHWAATHVPANATLVMVGDFAAADAIAAAKKHFEAIPRGEPAPAVATTEPPQEGERRVSLARAGDARRLQVSWKAPAVTDPDFAALLVADAILGGAKGTNLWSTSDRAASRSSRLHKRLLVTGLAREASSRLHPTADPFLLSVRVALEDGADSTRAEQAVVDAAESLGRDVPAKELDRAKAALSARLVFESASPTDLAHQLGLFETLDPGGAGWRTALRLPDAVAAVTAAEVKRAAAKWLVASNRTVGWFVPSSRAPREASLEGPARYSTHGTLAAPAKAAATPPPPPLGPKVTRTVLSNGLVVLSVRNPIAPEVSVRIDVKSGSALEAPENAGLASLTARLAASGSGAKDEAAIAAALEAEGATLETAAGVERVTLRARMLAADAPAVLATLREIVAAPSFPKEAFDREKALAVAEARAREDEPAAVAEATLRATLYPPADPRSRHPGGRPDTILALARADAGEFHRETWRPERTVVVISGDLDPNQAAYEVKKAFASWRGVGAAAKKPELPVVAPPPPMWIGRVHLDGPGPTEIALGWPLSISRSHADWAALALLDASLSGRNGRLATTLRDERAWTALDSGEMPGPFLVRARAEPKRADDAVEAMRAVLTRLAQEGLATEDLAAAKDRASGDLARRFESNLLICDFFADVEHGRLGIDYARRLSAQLQSLTVEDVNRAAKDHIRTDGAAVTAGPKK